MDQHGENIGDSMGIMDLHHITSVKYSVVDKSTNKDLQAKVKNIESALQGH
jgi:hypothetical protein